MRNRSLSILLAVVLASAGVLSAQEKARPAGGRAEEAAKPSASRPAMSDVMAKFSSPGPEHKILQEKEGVWDVESLMWLNPEAPAEAPARVTRGVSTFRPILGGRYMEQSHEGEMLNGPFSARAIMGYDRFNKKYITLWLDTTGTGFNLTEGTCDAEGKVCTETGEWDDPSGGAAVKVKSVITRQSADKFVAETFVVQPDAGDVRIMEETYTRRHGGKAGTPEGRNTGKP